jgi:YrbI family 3-deoxy-D-manno-octulosonate 8-phosphate phosphatase
MQEIPMTSSQERLAKIKVLVLDNDGVLTDGGLLYLEAGPPTIRFDIQDGLGIVVARQAGIETAIISGRSSAALQRRATELGIKEILLGIDNKAQALRELTLRRGWNLSEVAYMGDDLNDLPAMALCGAALAPANAAPEVKAAAVLVTENRGGRGAVREALQTLLAAQDRWQAAVKQYLEILDDTSKGNPTNKKKAKKKSQGNANSSETPEPSPASALHALEKGLAELQRQLKAQGFSSGEAAEDFLAATMENKKGRRQFPIALTPLEQAQEIMYDAWEAKEPECISLALKALKVSPDCADAYVLLAEETTQDLDEARQLYEQGVAAGKRALGEDFFREEVGNFWGVIESRPYMRARFGLAQVLWEKGNKEAAVAHYRDLLHLNPNDNQGVRYFLVNSLLALGLDEEAEQLLKDFKEEESAFWLYNWALLAYRRSGDSATARRKLRQARKYNPHVIDYLSGSKPIPQELPEFFGFGDDAEAVVCAAECLELWQQTVGALDWLRSQE